MTSVSWGILGNIKAKMADEVASNIVRHFWKGISYYANLFHTGDIKEADNPIDNVICRHSD